MNVTMVKLFVNMIVKTYPEPSSVSAIQAICLPMTVSVVKVNVMNVTLTTNYIHCPSATRAWPSIRVVCNLSFKEELTPNFLSPNYKCLTHVFKFNSNLNLRNTYLKKTSLQCIHITLQILMNAP